MVPLQYLSFCLRDHGRVLATREKGQRVARHLGELVREPAHLLLDLAEVEVVTPPFLDELLGELQRVLQRHRDHGGFAIAVNLNEDVRETFEMVLERRRHALAYWHEDQLGLLGGNPHLARTLREARQLGEFTAPELAERLALKLSNANQRLSALQAAGAVSRERDLDAERGIRFRYQAAGRHLESAKP